MSCKYIEVDFGWFFFLNLLVSNNYKTSAKTLMLTTCLAKITKIFSKSFRFSVTLRSVGKMQHIKNNLNTENILIGFSKMCSFLESPLQRNVVISFCVQIKRPKLCFTRTSSSFILSACRVKSLRIQLLKTRFICVETNIEFDSMHSQSNQLYSSYQRFRAEFVICSLLFSLPPKKGTNLFDFIVFCRVRII